jgi:WD40 repeat protein
VRTIDFGGPTGNWQVGPDTLFAETGEGVSGRQVLRLRSWRLPDGDARELGRVDWSRFDWKRTFAPNGRGWLYAKGDSVYLRPLPTENGRNDRLLWRHQSEVTTVRPLPEGSWQVYSEDQAGEIQIWDFSQDEPKLAKVIPGHEPSARWAVAKTASDRQARVWNLDRWPQARPLTLRRSGSWFGAIPAFHPHGDWLVMSTQGGFALTFWPLRGVRPSVVDEFRLGPLAFSPDGRWLATRWTDRTVRLWPLPGSGSRDPKTLALPEGSDIRNLVFDPEGRFLFVVGGRDRADIVPLDGSTPRSLERFSDHTRLSGAAVSPSGRRVATAFSFGRGSRTLRVWDLETGEAQLFDLPVGSASATGFEWGIWDLAFADESTLYTAGDGGVRRWNLESGADELVFATKPGHDATMTLRPDGRTALVHVGQLGNPEACGPVEILELATGGTRTLPAVGDGCSAFRRAKIALDTSGTVAVSGDREGIVRVGRVSGGEPHLLVGHEGPVGSVAVSPDGRWIASTGEDSTLRLWPTPDLDKPPLHTLSHDELIAKLKSLTNLRVVRDPNSAEGWKVELAPFPGWKKVPTW